MMLISALGQLLISPISATSLPVDPRTRDQCDWSYCTFSHPSILDYEVSWNFWLMWPWRVKMPTQNFLMLLLLLMLMMRIGNIWCGFGSWGFVIKLNFCSDFQHKVFRSLKLEVRRDFEAEVWSVFCCWCLVEVTRLNLGQDYVAKFGQDFKFKSSRDDDVWLRF